MGTDLPDRSGDDGDRAPAAPDSFFRSDNVWVLIPLAALSIPILAVTSEGPLVWVVGAVAIVAAITAALRHLVLLRHRLRLEELAAQERLSLAERERFAAIDQLVDGDRAAERLRAEWAARTEAERAERRPEGPAER